ncbi:MAG: hypothetical protein JW953_17660 [Anaerolineae bacterium]|nr:hypothetical protein [Anaerolineae bacterium]
MSKQLYRWLKNQPKIEVIAKAEDSTANTNTWLAVFAFAFMGFFFFFSGALWRALMAGG